MDASWKELADFESGEMNAALSLLCDVDHSP
jgi:hypothetical protein